MDRKQIEAFVKSVKVGDKLRAKEDFGGLKKGDILTVKEVADTYPEDYSFTGVFIFEEAPLFSGYPAKYSPYLFERA